MSRTTATSAQQVDLGPKLPLTSKVGYGMGDFASQLVWTMASSYLAIFYTDNVGLGAGVVGIIMVIARALDAIIDPLIGNLADRTRTRWGRFRPWLLIGAPVLAALSVLAYTSPFSSDGLKTMWAIVTYGLLGIAYSAVNVPYGALAVVMSDRSDDRVALTTFRTVGSNLGSVLLSAISLPLILLFSGVGDGVSTTVMGYTITTVVFAVVALPLFYFVFRSSNEVVTPIHEDRVPLGKAFRVVFGNRSLMMVFIFCLLSLTAFFGRLGVVIFYFKYSVNEPAVIPVLQTAPFVGTAIGIALFVRFSTRIGKGRLLIISGIVQAAALLGIFFTNPSNVTAIIIFSVIYGLADLKAPLFFAMIADCVDEIELRTGVRVSGTAYATVSFSTKFAAAIGGSLGIALLGVFGYVANATQTAESLTGINVTVNLLPAILIVLSLVPIFFYRIGEKEVATTSQSLRTIRTGGES